MNRRVTLLNDLRPSIMDISPDDYLRPRMLLRQRKHFRNRQGFEDAMAGEDQFIRERCSPATCSA